MIYEHIKNYGSWELNESQFLAEGLKKANLSGFRKIALLDIGANTGLVTLQALNLSQVEKIEVFLFEPILRHILALEHNFKSLINIHFEGYALSSLNGESNIYTEEYNHGNSSMWKSLVAPIGMIETKVKLVKTSDYCKNFLTKFDAYIIKSDTQGMDALIMSRIPSRIWKKIECCIIEVWAINEISALDVDNLLLMSANFKYISWNSKSKERIGSNEIREFWLSKSGAVRNLYYSKV
jgi:FkbM family methyltransferase